MTTIKRFYRQAGVAKAMCGYALTLDGTPAKTPGKRPAVMPIKTLAEEVADEWQAQDKTISFPSMPLTRIANSAIDLVAVERAHVVKLVADYAASDLLCHRAAHPAKLKARQETQWSPLLLWLSERYGVSLHARSQILPISQPAASLARLHQVVSTFEDFPLAALHRLTSESGSLVLALALAEKRIDADTLWSLCQLDEDFQAENWGRDSEAEARRRDSRQCVLAASRVLTLCRSTNSNDKLNE